MTPAFAEASDVPEKVLAEASDVPEKVLLAGFGEANRAVARALTSRGHVVSAFDDRPQKASTTAAQALGIELEIAPSNSRLAELMRAADLLIPTPGLGHDHRVLEQARSMRVSRASEFDLARVWDRRGIVAVTGTSGKTTTTEMIVAALNASGINALAAGNNELPLVEAIEQREPEAFVVEASSFRLSHTQKLTALAACWLNFAPDHLDVHADLDAYRSAKARIWQHLAPQGRAIANLCDETVMACVPAERDLWTFAVDTAADWRRDDGWLTGPIGAFMAVAELRRALPHDIANALAAAATASAVGATPAGVRDSLSAFEHGEHRVQHVGRFAGLDFYDDSKATTPHAVLAALGCFESSVLIAGGRNKGLDLSVLRRRADRVHTVVALGEAAAEVSEVFDGVRPVLTAADMREAVELAVSAAAAPMAVLLSPACSSFDAYSGYGERGRDFAGIVKALAENSTSQGVRS